MLQEMNLIDDPAASYAETPLNRRLEMLRDCREQWGIKWTTSHSAPVGEFDCFSSIRGEAGVLYIAAYRHLGVQELHWTNLPSSMDQEIEWNLLRPTSKNIVAHALSIEENDLVAFVTTR
jgi:hypothetical protein